MSVCLHQESPQEHSRTSTCYNALKRKEDLWTFVCKE